MKNRIYCLFLFLFVIIISSCSDWEKDPTSVSKVELKEEEPSGVLVSTNFPKNITVFLYDTDSIFIVGTKDGEFYKSNNRGKSWIKTGEMSNKDRINYLLSAKKNNQTFILACTNKGGYLSTNNGSTWKEILAAQDKSGNYRKVTYGYFSSTYDKFYITFYTVNDTLNYFKSSDFGNTWETSSKIFPIINCTDCYFTSDVQSYNSNMESALIHGVDSTFFKENMEFLSPMSYSINYDIHWMVGSKKGILLSKDYGKTWMFKSLADKKIYSISYYGTPHYIDDDDQIYAGTSDGLYVSMDGGYNWIKYDAFERNEPITYTFLIGNYLYLVTSSGETYCFKISEDKDKTLLIPVPLSPAYDETCNSSPMLKWNRTGGYNTVVYKLQISKDSSFNNIIAEERLLKNYYQTNLTEKGVKYFWRIRSEKLIGISEWSDASCFTIK